MIKRKLKRIEDNIVKMGNAFSNSVTDAQEELEKAKNRKQQFDEILREKTESEERTGTQIERIRDREIGFKNHYNELVSLYNDVGYTYFRKKVKTHLWLRNLLIVLSSVFGVGTVTFMILFLLNSGKNTTNIKNADISSVIDEILTNSSKNTDDNEDKNIAVELDKALELLINKYSKLSMVDDDTFKEFYIYLNKDELDVSLSKEELEKYANSFYNVLGILSTYNTSNDDSMIPYSDFIVNSDYRSLISHIEKDYEDVLNSNYSETSVESFVKSCELCAATSDMLNTQTKEIISCLVDQFIEKIRNIEKYSNIADRLEKVLSELHNDPSVAKAFNYDTVFSKNSMLVARAVNGNQSSVSEHVAPNYSFRFNSSNNNDRNTYLLRQNEASNAVSVKVRQLRQTGRK